MHYNPMQEKWNLCKNQEDYRWSSAKFYFGQTEGFEFLTHYLDRF
jgi:putative transposase